VTRDLSGLEVYVKPGITDLRKQINGLVAVVQDVMHENPLSGSLFLFCNRSRKLMKCVYWDKTGFCLWLKKLEQDRFPWPETEEAVRQITTEELHMLLDGIDFWKAHTPVHYEELV
jgi:transposase